MTQLVALILVTCIFLVYEPFGLGRFATDYSLTKAASRPLSARVRRYAPHEITKNIIFEISMLEYPIWSLESSESDYF